MAFRKRLLVCFGLAVLLAGCENSVFELETGQLDPVFVRVWDTEKNLNYFPELDDPVYKVPRLEHRLTAWPNGEKPSDAIVRDQPKFGIAFSGGGTRSAAATLGQLRALRKLGWIKEAAYISAVSGGSWTAVPFTYLLNSSQTKEEVTAPGCKNADDKVECEFFGRYVPPWKLTEYNLDDIGPTISERGLKSMASAISSSLILPHYLANAALGNGDEIYSRTIGNIFLEPFGINDDQSFFAVNNEHAKLIREKNRALYEQINNERKKAEQEFEIPDLENIKFLTARSDRPYLIVGGTLISRSRGGEQNIFPLEITPLYTGIRRRFRICGEEQIDQKQIIDLERWLADKPEWKGKEKIDDIKKLKSRWVSRYIGGGYMETFAYDSKLSENARSREEKACSDKENEHCPSRLAVRLESTLNRFTLSDVIGISGAAPQEFAVGLGLLNVGFPEMQHRPIKEYVLDKELDPIRERKEKGIWPVVKGLTGEDWTEKWRWRQPPRWPECAGGPPSVVPKEYSHGDGGHADNLGLMPLLARKVKNILVFVNTATPFRPRCYQPTFAEMDPEMRLRLCRPIVDEDLPITKKTDIHADNIVDDVISFFRPINELPFNLVFDKGEIKLDELYRAFEWAKLQKPVNKSKGQPLVYCSEYRVKDNERYGITEYDSNICWVYLDRTCQWYKMIKESDLNLRPATKDGETTEDEENTKDAFWNGPVSACGLKARKLRPEDLEVTALPSTKGRYNLFYELDKDRFRNFPHLKTFLEGKVKAIDLNPRVVNALANLTTWTVLEAAGTIADNFPFLKNRLPTNKDMDESWRIGVGN